MRLREDLSLKCNTNHMCPVQRLVSDIEASHMQWTLF